MATKHKQGLDYFPFNVDFLSDCRIRRLIKNYGPQTVSVLVKLLSVIHKYEGYYMPYNDDTVFSVGECLYMEENQVREIIQKSIEAEMFDAEKFEQYQILTSKSIQDNYFFATERRKHKTLNPEYIIENQNINTIKEETPQPCQQTMQQNVTSCIHDATSCEQRKVKKIKEDKSKVKKKEKKGGGGKKKESNEEMQKNIPSLSSLQPPPPPPSWKIDYKIYIQELAQAYNDIIRDKHYMEYKQRLYPEMDIKKTLEKIISEYWGTHQGWNQKKKHPDDIINWKLTFDKQMNYPYNVIRKT